MQSEHLLPITEAEHTRLLHALRESEILRELAEILASSLDLSHILQVLAKRTSEVCAIERCSIWLIHDNHQQLVPSAYYFSQAHLQQSNVEMGETLWPESTIPLEHPTIAHLFAKEGSLFINDLRVTIGLQHIAEQFFVRSVLLIALKRDNEPVGMISLDNPGKKYQVTAEQIQLAKAIGPQAALAINNAQLYKEAQSERKRANNLIERMQSIYEVTHAINSGEDLATTLQIATQHLIAMLHADSAAITLLQENTLHVIHHNPCSLSATAAHRQNEPYHADPVTSPRLTELPHCYQAAMQGTPLFVTAPQRKGREEQWYQQLGLQNCIVVPLILGPQRKSDQASRGTQLSDSILCIGFAFINYAQRIDSPSKGQYAFACDIAAQCALAIEKDRILAEAQQAAKQVTEQAQTLQAVFNAMSEGIMVVDAQGNLIMSNTTAAAFLGISPTSRQALIPLMEQHPSHTTHGQFIPPENFPLVRALKGEIIHGERFVALRADGSKRTIEVNVAPLYDNQDQRTGLVGAFRDVTEQVRIDRRIRHALDTMLHAVEAVSEHTDIKDILSTVLKMTNTSLYSECGFIELYDQEHHLFFPVHSVGLSEAEEMQWRAAHMNTPSHDISNYDILRELMQEGYSVLMKADEYPHYPAASAQPHDQHILVAPIMRNDSLLGVMVFDRVGSQHTQQQSSASTPAPSASTTFRRDFGVWDLTLAEGIAQFTGMALEEARWQQEAAAARTNEAAMRASNEQKDQFLAITAHEFRTPLTVILAHNQMMARILRKNEPFEKRERERFHESITAIEEQTRQLTSIVNAFLEVTRLKRGQLELVSEELDLAELARQAIQTQSTTANNHTISLHIAATEHPYLVHGDAARLLQVFTNLLQNAIKYSPLGGPITISMRQQRPLHQPAFVEVSVQDTGIGVPEDAKAYLFDCFYRAPNVEGSQTHGVGLGLYVVAEFLRLQGGTIQVESSGILGEGSTFTFTLPLLEKD